MRMLRPVTGRMSLWPGLNPVLDERALIFQGSSPEPDFPLVTINVCLFGEIKFYSLLPGLEAASGGTAKNVSPSGRWLSCRILGEDLLGEAGHLAFAMQAM